VSRAHGLDVYEERHSPPFIPFRDRTLDGLERLFAVSQNGREYLAERYPRSSRQLRVARLGVRRQPAPTPASTDGVLRVVSCASAIPLKRLPLIHAACAALASRRPVEWTHVGDGPELAAVRSEISRNGGLRCNLLGSMPNEAVLALYARGPFDVFVNASTTEGVPVSVMEAMSFGIPIVATAVGGVPELVSRPAGRLVAPDARPEDIARAIEELASDPTARPMTREAFRSIADADANYSAFAGELVDIASAGCARTIIDVPPNQRTARSGSTR
jgi:glycosyltransferase involved in cell wall biosynthesis